MSTQSQAFLTPEQYLEIERKAEFRSEYLNGEVVPMSGGNRWHGQIASHLAMLLQQHTADGPCEGYAANMRVLTPSGLYTYPDLLVVCDEPRFTDSELDTLTNPALLVEILSPSTENYDLGKKAAMYRTIPELREILFIAQDRYHVQLQRRKGDTWTLIEVEGLDKSVELTSIGYTLQLAELYRSVVKHRG